MKKIELEKHKFDQRLRLSFFFILIVFAGYLVQRNSPLAGEIIALVVGLTGGSIAQLKS